MAKVIVTKLGVTGGRGGKSASVGEKRVRDGDGKLQTLRTLDGHSETFSHDLTYVFARNVAKARRDNKKITGVTDRVPAKG
jgi:hypothetical protein